MRQPTPPQLWLTKGIILTPGWYRQADVPAPYPAWGSELLPCYPVKEQFISLPLGSAQQPGWGYLKLCCQLKLCATLSSRIGAAPAGDRSSDLAQSLDPGSTPICRPAHTRAHQFPSSPPHSALTPYPIKPPAALSESLCQPKKASLAFGSLGQAMV